MQEIHVLLRQGVHADKISSQLSPWAFALFEFLPPFIKKQVYIYILLNFLWIPLRLDVTFDLKTETFDVAAASLP